MNFVHVDLRYNFAERGGIRVNLHAYLAEALYALHGRHGEIVSKSDMAKALWGMEKLHPRKWNRLLDTYISQLRRQIEPLGGRIENKRFEGYRLSWEVWSLDTGRRADLRTAA